MKDKTLLPQPVQLTHDDFEKYILNIVNRFIPVLFLQRHTFEIHSGTERESSYFDFIYNYPYLNQKMGYSDKAFKDWLSNKDMESYILHEICHALTDPLYSKAVQRYVSKDEIEDERERLTDHICNVVLNLTKELHTHP